MDGNTIDEPIAEEVKVDPVTAATPGVSLASSSFLFKTPLDIRLFFKSHPYLLFLSVCRTLSSQLGPKSHLC